jgi:protein TonB
MWTFLSRDPLQSPFSLCQEQEGGRWSLSFTLSAAAHLIILLAVCWPARPVFVKPNLLARGDGGTSAPMSVALYLPQDLAQAQPQPAKISLPSAQQAQKVRAKVQQRHNVLEEEKPKDNAELGSTLGSASDGPVYGDEVKPALPVAFSDPRISRWEVPGGIQGDVVVEITIDVQGNVAETRLLQGLGHGIDERVIAAVREWRFRPATRNGVTIPSKHDYRFHFPS